MIQLSKGQVSDHMNDFYPQLNAPTKEERLSGLQSLLPSLRLPPMGTDVNNHIHTTYSFSPYSPTAAAWKARASGLCTAGIMDHDTIMGAREFLAACEMLGIGGTCGLECRVSFAGTGLGGKRINNPDQVGVGYMMLHAVPHARIEEVDSFFAPLRQVRNERNRRMVDRLNRMLQGADIALSFERDVLPLSLYAQGGVVTERHIASALAMALESRTGRGARLVDFLHGAFCKCVGEKYRTLFSQADNPYFHYDLIGWIKAELVPDFYIEADAECAHVRDVLALSERVGAISAYAYLGDIGDSVTGDKRAQKFEDDYLDALFDEITSLGFRAVTYMPTRNTPAQIARLREKIHAGGFFEISGEDINQPRQQFVCMAMREAGFDALRESAWAMVAHERDEEGLFSESMVGAYPKLDERVREFARKGRAYAGV